MRSEAETEAEIVAKGLTAPRLKPDDIDAAIVKENYHRFPGTTLTVCVLTLRNGFTVTGESAAASPENFDWQIGQKIARENARNKIWALEGYLLRDVLHSTWRAKTPEVNAAILSHEVNRLWCRMNGDFSQLAWPDAPDWQKQSALLGVAFHQGNPEAGPEASHENWRRDKVADGWVYGPVKDPAAKQHPCMVDFDQLPLHQQIKDRLFRAVVHAVLGDA